MNAFANTIDVLFVDPNLAVDALYSYSGGDSVAVRIILSMPAQEEKLFTTGINRTAYGADVRISEISAPLEGDTLTIGADSFTVRKAILDTEKLVWKLDLNKI